MVAIRKMSALMCLLEIKRTPEGENIRGIS
jgi:hypothetical protein